MGRGKPFVLAILSIALLSLIVVAPAGAAGQAGKGTGKHRFIVKARSDAEYDALRSDAINSGATVIEDLRAVRTLVVSAPDSVKATIAASSHAQSVAADQVRSLVRPALASELGFKSSPSLDRHSGGGKHGPLVFPDPASSLPGLMWNLDRIHSTEALQVTTGSPAVMVGVADTGLDFTHSELAPRIASVVDFTADEDPPLCSTFFGASDADFAAEFGGPATTDWNGHGSWIGGNIAGALDGTGINGIAPNVKLVALKISGWCGSAYDSTILNAFLYAADHGIDIVSISFGGYLDRSDPEQDAIYQAYVDAVSYAASKGTVIVAAAGNEHVRIGDGGRVLSHGSLTIPGDAVVDLFGLYEVPGGIPGVVDVSATGNVVVGSSPSCAPDKIGANAVCKPASDLHQPTGVGKLNQLTYYSNYGPRIDVAAPGGARKFNVPSADRGGTPGFPYTTDDGYTAFEDFSITSNWALEIPCFFDLPAPTFYNGECYTSIQGTSMATPHASAVLALIASSDPKARHDPKKLVNMLRAGARPVEGNTTPGLSATDFSPGDRTGIACPTGYCHLGGPAIKDKEVYGAGLVDAFKSVK